LVKTNIGAAIVFELPMTEVSKFSNVLETVENSKELYNVKD